MAKRTASSDINHENWDAKYEPEEAGSFEIASQDALQKRIFKTAKRRVKTSEKSVDGGKSVFASFGGFKPAAPSLSSGTSTTFSFLGGGTSSSGTPTPNGTTSTTLAKSEVTPEKKYLANLQQLNRSVTDWIKTHVDANPVCILTPVFSDYEKHLKQIKAERDAGEKSGSAVVSSTPSSLSSFNFVSSSTSDNKFTINMPPTTVNSDKKTFTLTDTNVNTKLSDSKPSTLMFGLSSGSGKSPLLKGAETNKTPSLFSSFKSDSTGSSLLTKPDPASLMVNPFTSVLKKPEDKPLSFSNGSTPTSSSSSSNQEKKKEEEESDEPPKVEFTPVQEEGSVFSTRCKVFIKKDNDYKDRGVGTLFIKKVGEEKHQLLVRAETVLGNIMMNVLLSSSIPSQRMGKNNVMLVCLPTPQDPPPPTTVLLRVKTAEDADDLLAKINQYKH